MIIGICDDEGQILEQLKKRVDQYMKEREGCYQILLFHSGKEVLENEIQMDVLFLDIDMPELDGIQVGEQLAYKQRNCKIIMATGMVERFKEAFQIRAFRFITKPFQEEEIREALSAVLNDRIGTKTIEVSQKRLFFTVEQREISFVRAINGYVELWISGSYYRKKMTLSELEKELEAEMFYRISKQYIVNLSKIEKYREGIAVIEGQKLKIAVRRRKEFERALLQYDLKG